MAVAGSTAVVDITAAATVAAVTSAPGDRDSAAGHIHTLEAQAADLRARHMVDIAAARLTASLAAVVGSMVEHLPAAASTAAVVVDSMAAVVDTANPLA